jgi:hypothetical protein
MVSLLTAFIAIIVAIITLLQWITARQKVVLDLFDKRFAVYEELRGVIGRYSGHGPNLEDIGKFTQAASRAQFLFGSEVTEFLEHKRLDLNREFVARERNPQPVPEAQRKAAEDAYAARLNHLTDFFKDFDVLVAPYMKHTKNASQFRTLMRDDKS